MVQQLFRRLVVIIAGLFRPLFGALGRFGLLLGVLPGLFGKVRILTLKLLGNLLSPLRRLLCVSNSVV